MNAGMAIGALFRSRRPWFRAMCRRCHCRAVALRAQRCDVRLPEHVSALRTVRAVTCRATLGFDGAMLVGEWTAHLPMAFAAHLVDFRVDVVARRLGRVEDLGGVAVCRYVRAAGAMAGFARVADYLALYDLNTAKDVDRCRFLKRVSERFSGW